MASDRPPPSPRHPRLTRPPDVEAELLALYDVVAAKLRKLLADQQLTWRSITIRLAEAGFACEVTHERAHRAE